MWQFLEQCSYVRFAENEHNIWLKLVTWLTALFKQCSSASQKFLYDLSSSFLLNGEAIRHAFISFYQMPPFAPNLFRHDITHRHKDAKLNKPALTTAPT